jgi:hypothetical protein
VLDLLPIVERLREFKGMFWGQKVTISTDHQNIVRDTVSLKCGCVYRWRLILKEYYSEKINIMGTDNIVADEIST